VEVLLVTGVAWIGCAHLGSAPYLEHIRCPKVCCVHPSKWSLWLRASVPKKTLACIRFGNDPCVHPFSSHSKPIFESNHPKLWSLLPDFYDNHRVLLSNPCLSGDIQSIGAIPHATWTLTVSAVGVILCCKIPVVKTKVSDDRIQILVFGTWKRMHARVISWTDVRKGLLGYWCTQPERPFWRMYATDFWATDARKVWGKSQMRATYIPDAHNPFNQ